MERRKVATFDNTSVIVPALNEIRTVCQVVSELAALGFAQIIVVDDGSSDGTGAAVCALGLKTVTLLVNGRPGGKGAAVLKGLAEVTSDYVIMQDADLEYPVAELSKLLGSNCDMVVGIRSFETGLGMSLPSFIVNSCFRWLLASPDPFSGQRLLETGFMRSLNLQSAGFDIETEIVLKATSYRGVTRHVPVAYHPRTREEGKKIGARDLFRICGRYLSYRCQALFS